MGEPRGAQPHLGDAEPVTLFEQAAVYAARGAARISPFLIPAAIGNMAAGETAMTTSRGSCRIPLSKPQLIRATLSTPSRGSG